MFQSSDPTNQSKLLRLHILNTFIPRLRQWIETGSTHPMRAFFELASLAGALGTMPGAHASWDLPLYEHRDAAPVFDALFGYIADVLETSDPTNWEKVAFSREGDFFVADLGTVTLDRESKFILSVRAPIEEAQLKTTLRPGSAKFGSPTKVPHYHRNALRGIDFQVLGAAPPDIPGDTGCVYVKVETLHRDWAKVEEERSLAAMLPGVPPETQLELFIVRRGGGSGR
jgi:predicted component of type VI protein secretion system